MFSFITYYQCHPTYYKSKDKSIYQVAKVYSNSQNAKSKYYCSGCMKSWETLAGGQEGFYPVVLKKFPCDHAICQYCWAIRQIVNSSNHQTVSRSLMIPTCPLNCVRESHKHIEEDSKSCIDGKSIIQDINDEIDDMLSTMHFREQS